MIDLERILEKYSESDSSFLSFTKEGVLSAMREACNQAIDACADVKFTTIRAVRSKASEYAKKEWSNDFTGTLIEYAKKDFIEGAEWASKEIRQSIPNVKQRIKP